MSALPDDDRPGAAAAARPAAAAADPGRRALVRGAAVFGIAGASGLLSACGGGGDAVAEPAAVPLADAPKPTPPAKLPTKSEVYRRTPEPRARGTVGEPKATPKPPAPEPAAAGDPPPASEPATAKVEEPPASKAGGGPQTTARKPKPSSADAGHDAGAKPHRPAPPPEEKPTPAPAASPPVPPAGPAKELSGARTADIPVGGGRIYPKDKVVVTQPTAGNFKAFSAACTHQGCIVAEVRPNDGILCFCHGSKFSIADGTVLRGPAILPLPAEQISVDGDKIVHGGHSTGAARRRFRRDR